MKIQKEFQMDFAVKYKNEIKKNFYGKVNNLFFSSSRWTQPHAHFYSQIE